MRKLDYQKMIEWLAVVLRCPVCGNKYGAEQTHVIEAKDQGAGQGSASFLVHTDCERCLASVVFSIALDGPEIFSAGMVTDLTAADAKRFRDARELSADDLIDLHLSLDKFDGDLEKALTA